ncbi:beta-lactamase family protein [Hypoxylon sp. NC1633]|nr:beta-lactamase family protein [Hypoxylon sp. NC1633]
MSTFESQIASAVESGTVPGVVVVATDKEGKINFSKAFSPKNGTHYTEETVFEMASMTKLHTTVAALQLVEKGLVALDEDVSRYIPSFAQQLVLTGFTDNGEPITHERQNPITLNHLLTHSAGAGYEFLHPQYAKYAPWRKTPRKTGTIDEAFDLPLLYEPGDAYAYSSSIDRVGQVIEKITGGNLEKYMKKNIWGPLGMNSTSFSPGPELEARRVPMTFRKDPAKAVVEVPGAHTFTTGLKEPFGGQGSFSTMGDHAKLLHSLLVDDEKVLKKETTALMFQPHLSPKSKASLLEQLKDPSWMIGDFPLTNEYDWGLGGVLIDGDKHDYRGDKTLIWSGAANLYWFIDRKAGICGAFGTQVMPASDLRVKNLIVAFEKEIYGKAGKLQKL